MIIPKHSTERFCGAFPLHLDLMPVASGIDISVYDPQMTKREPKQYCQPGWIPLLGAPAIVAKGENLRCPTNVRGVRAVELSHATVAMEVVSNVTLLVAGAKCPLCHGRGEL
jgi:hypothetical protein